MARIELKHCTVSILDGFGGSAAVGDAGATEGATTIPIDGTSLNVTPSNEVPIGSRFTVGSNETVYTVTGVTPGTGATTSVDVTPAVPIGEAMSDGDELSFLPNELEIKIGDGNITYSETKNYEYDLDRGQLDTVREGDEAPMDVSLQATYEHITAGSGEAITPIDAIKRRNNASSWVTSSADPCEPYSVDVKVVHEPPCGSSEKETTIFPDFRYETIDVSFEDATISFSGRCNATEPIVSRG